LDSQNVGFALAIAIIAAPGTGQVSVPRANFPVAEPADGRVIAIGVIGGSVRREDAKQDKVHLAAYHRRPYTVVEAEAFEAHHERRAPREVVLMIDSGGHGIFTPKEKRESTIMISGRSWGAAETVTSGHAPRQMRIPVAQTIQANTIAKPGCMSGITSRPSIVGLRATETSGSSALVAGTAAGFLHS
jgi:hypothetical protein